MKRFLCRAKDKRSGKWVEGFIYEHQPPLQCIVPENYIPEKSKWYILNTAFADWNLPRQVDFAEVDPDTICRYAGINDTNKKPIFEGDIVESVSWNEFWCRTPDMMEAVRRKLEVRIINGSVTLCEYNLDFGMSTKWCNCQRNGQDLTIIGNVYDNPELLPNRNGGDNKCQE